MQQQNEARVSADGSPTAEQQGGIKTQNPQIKLIQDKFTSLMATDSFQPQPKSVDY